MEKAIPSVVHYFLLSLFSFFSLTKKWKIKNLYVHVPFPFYWTKMNITVSARSNIASAAILSHWVYTSHQTAADSSQIRQQSHIRRQLMLWDIVWVLEVSRTIWRWCLDVELSTSYNNADVTRRWISSTPALLQFGRKQRRPHVNWMHVCCV